MKRFEARLGRLGVDVSVNVSVTHDRDVRVRTLDNMWYLLKPSHTLRTF